MTLYLSNTTIALLGGHSSKVLVSKAASLGCCQALVDFVLFDREYIGEKVGQWLEDAHSMVGCKLLYIGSRIVDGAAHAEKSISVLKWRTSDDRASQIVTSKCDAHQVNTAGKHASGMSDHTVNLNPELGSSLNLLHTNLTRTCPSGKRMNVVKNVQKEHKRTRTVVLESAVAPR